MKKLNSVINDPWRTTCAVCGSYETYVKNGELTSVEVYKGVELVCDNCGEKIVIVYDKKQNKKVHYETLL